MIYASLIANFNIRTIIILVEYFSISEFSTSHH